MGALTANALAKVSVRRPTQQVAGMFYDCDDTLVFDYQILANAQVIGLQQPIASDADFYLCGVAASSVIIESSVTQEFNGNVGLRFTDSTGYRLMSDYVDLAFFNTSFGNPYPYVINPSHVFKAGTRINIDIQELSGGNAGVSGSGFPSNVQIAFRGRYRYRLMQ